MNRALLALGALALALLPGAGAATPAAAIAFNVSRGPNPDVALIDADGTNFRNLTPGDQTFYVGDQNPSWSPDGTKLAFESHRDSNVSTEIYVMNADGSDQRRLTTDGPNGVQSVSAEIFDTAPAWSPRGDLIAYVKIVGQNRDIWVMNPDGSGQRRLTSDGGRKSDLQWSPDARTLLYSLGDRIYTVAAAGGEPVALTPPGGADSSPVWSPDGSRIAFVSTQLWVTNADGSGRRRLTDLPSGSPSWSPDGSKLAFVGTRSFPKLQDRFGTPTRSDVWVVNADGTGERRLTGPFGEAFGPVPGGDKQPSWWPDGSRLFYASFVTSTTNVMNADGTCEGRFAPGAPHLLRPVWKPGSNPGLPPIACAELRISGSTAPDTVALGAPAHYQVSIDNDGNEFATGLRLEIGATEGIQPTSTAAGCAGAGSSMTCDLQPLAPGGTVKLDFFTVSSKASSVTLKMHVSAVEPDTDLTNNDLQLYSQTLPCTIVGTPFSDVIYGTPGPDKICARTGADRIYGGAGNDFIDADGGDDTIYGGPGRDTILGRGGRDVVYARDSERDWIDCGTERDVAIVDRFDVVRHCEVVIRPKR